jgi:hypothetical protein
MKTLYGLIADNGDGSNSVNWYTNKELVDYLLTNDESYYGNEGSPAVTLTIPDELPLESLGLFNIDEQSIDEYGADFEQI